MSNSILGREYYQDYLMDDVFELQNGGRYVGLAEKAIKRQVKNEDKKKTSWQSKQKIAKIAKREQKR